MSESKGYGVDSLVHALPSGHLIALAFSSKTPRRSDGPPFGEKSTNIVPGKSSFALITKGCEPSLLSEPVIVMIFPWDRERYGDLIVGWGERGIVRRGRNEENSHSQQLDTITLPLP